MASDGSIIIDTELDLKGFEAGSSELLSAIKGLTGELSKFRDMLKGLAAEPIRIKTDTSQAESGLKGLQTQTERLRSTTGESGIQKEINGITGSVEKLEPIFTKAMNGSESAMSSFETKANELDGKIAGLQERLTTFGETRFHTEEYDRLNAEIESVGQKFDVLVDRQEKMQALGVSQKSSQWKSLQYDMEQLSAKYEELIQKRNELEGAGRTSFLGSDTPAYEAMTGALESAAARIMEMREAMDGVADDAGQTESRFRGIAAKAGAVAFKMRDIAWNTTKAAASAAGKLATGMGTAAIHMAGMNRSGKDMTRQFSGLISGAKKFALSLLGARGVYILLRRAVSAYMAENQELSATLSSCWTGIGNILGPVITKLINLVASAVSYVTAFLKLFGLYSSTATKAMSSAGSAASSAADDLKRQLASFDELNILSDTSSGGGGGGGGAGADAAGALPDVTLPDWAKLMAEQIKAGQWRDAARTLTSKLNEMVEGADWSGVGKKLGKGIGGVLAFLATAINTFDWMGLGSGIAVLVNNAMNQIDFADAGTVLAGRFKAILLLAAGFALSLDWASLGQNLSKFAISFFDTIADAIGQVDWQQLGQNVETFLENIDWEGVAQSFFRMVGVAFGGLAAFIKGLIEKPWESAMDWWKEQAGDDGKLSIEEFLGGILKGLGKIGKWLFDNVVQPFIDGFKEGLGFGEDGKSSLFVDFGSNLIASVLTGIVEAAQDIADWWGGFFSALAKGDVDAALEYIQKAVTGTADKTEKVVRSNTRSLKRQAGAAAEAAKEVADSATKCADTVSDASEDAAKIAEKAGRTVSQAASEADSQVTNKARNTKQSLSDRMGEIEAAATKTSGSIKNTVTETGSTVVSSVTSASGKANSAAKEELRILTNGVSDAGSQIKADVSANTAAVEKNISDSASKAESTITSSAYKAQMGMVEVGRDFREEVSGTTSAISSAVNKTFFGMEKTVSDGTKACINTASINMEGVRSAIVSKITAAAASIRDQGWYSIGTDICSGIANGISAGWSWLKNTVSNMASNLLSSAKSFLGIHSPSTMFRDEVGHYIALGIGEGIVDGKPEVLREVSGIADSISAELRDGTYSIGAVTAGKSGAVSRLLGDFSGQVTDSFTNLLDGLREIADRIGFVSPAANGSLVPYAVQAASAGKAGHEDVTGAIAASNEELSSVIIQSVTNATVAVVSAIQEYSGTTVNLDADSLTNKVIQEINRKTRMSGMSPLLA